jgi:iron complex outermembrane receptor protein
VTITVQGARPDGELAAEPFAATTRVRRERVAAPALRAPELLRSEAGVQVSEAGGLGAPATASIRGATAAQTPVYLGGVRLNDQVGGVADIAAIPLWLVDHVDVYRGNAPFGADEPGIGGAIFFEPRRPRKPEGAASMTAGSFGSRAGYGYAALGDDRWGVLAGVGAERADNDYTYHDDRGTAFEQGDDASAVRLNSDSRLTDGWLLFRARPSSRARLEFLGNHTSREQGAPKLALVPSLRARARLERNLASLSARLHLDDSGAQLLTLRTSWLDTSSALDDPARELGGLTTETRVRGRRAEQQGVLELPLPARLKASLAVSGAFESLQRRDDLEESSATASTLRGAARVDWQATPSTVVFGQGAAQCRATQPGSAGCAEVEPTGRFGVGFRARRFTAFANLSRYQRVPALGELYGAGVVVRGNPDLRSELGLAGDLGARSEVALSDRFGLRGQLSAFARQAHDLIAYARAAQGYVVPVNVGEARIAGLELSLGADAFRHLSVDCNVSLLDPRNTTEGRQLVNDILPYMSRLVVAPRLTVTTGELTGRELKSAELGVDVNYQSSRYADAAGLIVIPEQATTNLSASASWLAGSFITRARLVNLFDAERFDIVGYPLPGRSVYVSAEVRAE